MDKDWKVGFAKMFKERDNTSKIGNVVGVVTKVTPLQISILDGNVILDAEDLYCCDSVLFKLVEETITVSGTQLTILKKVQRTFELGDLVLLAGDETENKWFIIDKVIKL